MARENGRRKQDAPQPRGRRAWVGVWPKTASISGVSGRSWKLEVGSQKSGTAIETRLMLPPVPLCCTTILLATELPGRRDRRN